MASYMWAQPVLVAILSILVVAIIGFMATAHQSDPGNLGLAYRRWPAGGAAEVAADRRPTVLESSPVHRWKAVERWNPEHLATHGPEMLKQVWHSASPCLVYSSANGEFGGTTGMQGCGAGQPRPEPRPMAPSELLAAAERGVAPGVLYWQDELTSLGPALASEVDAAPLGIDEVEGSEVARLAWLGTRGATTQAHYDVEHNFFAQIYGTKRFVLWPPTSHAEMKLHPTRHSRHRQSQLDGLPTATASTTPATATTSSSASAATDTAAAISASEAAAAAAAASGARSLSVELRPGELLYVPPFWLHHVTATSALSASVSVWSASAETERRGRDPRSRHMATSTAPQPHRVDLPEPCPKARGLPLPALRMRGEGTVTPEATLRLWPCSEAVPTAPTDPDASMATQACRAAAAAMGERMGRRGEAHRCDAVHPSGARSPVGGRPSGS